MKAKQSSIKCFRNRFYISKALPTPRVVYCWLVVVMHVTKKHPRSCKCLLVYCLVQLVRDLFNCSSTSCFGILFLNLEIVPSQPGASGCSVTLVVCRTGSPSVPLVDRRFLCLTGIGPLLIHESVPWCLVQPVASRSSWMSTLCLGSRPYWIRHNRLAAAIHHFLWEIKNPRSMSWCQVDKLTHP